MSSVETECCVAGMTHKGGRKRTVEQRTHNICDVSEKEFTNYVFYKAFDVLSDGQYKKRVVKGKENCDAWAMEMYTAVQSLNIVIKSVTTEINSLHEYGKQRLQKVCLEVVGAMNPPCKVKSGWNICVITGLRSNDCIDLTRVGKSDSNITIHSRFTHFVLMLWFVVKIEHIIKVLTRNWLSSKGSGYEDGHMLKDICKDFEKEEDLVHSVFEIFSYAYQHVMLSLRKHKELSEFELNVATPSSKQ